MRIVVDGLYHVSLPAHAAHFYDRQCKTYGVSAKILIWHQELIWSISNALSTKYQYTHRWVLDILHHILVDILNDNLPPCRRIRDRLLRALLAILVLLMRMYVACITLRSRWRYLALLLRLQSGCFCFASLVDLAITVFLVAVEVLDELVDCRDRVVA